jgi:hypothetical protein
MRQAIFETASNSRKLARLATKVAIHYGIAASRQIHIHFAALHLCPNSTLPFISAAHDGNINIYKAKRILQLIVNINYYY